MNYGKYFRLNLKESKVVDGIAVYDYIDLPAYFGRSKSISPKYPITAVICQDSVRFRLHYCAYKVGEEGKNSTCKYLYSSEEALHLAHGNVEVQTVHMQEVILELPFVNGMKSSLAEAISKIYYTSFPLLGIEKNTNENANEKINNEGFVYQLLSKRYRPDVWRWETEDCIEEISYKTLQKNVDGDRSYSTIWLMDLLKEENDKKYIDLTDSKTTEDIENKKSKIVGFLRKLLLDFMFDLIHTDIFQSSPNYTEMCAGFKSDFLFSALAHKCEYYYYRALTLDAIKVLEEKPEKEQIERVKKLYANHLFEAEKKWVEDIMNPASDEAFQDPEDDFARDWKKIKKNSRDHSLFRIYPYWFATPEEEMKRVCFSLTSKKEKDGSFETSKVHLCNAETLAHYIKRKEREIASNREADKQIEKSIGPVQTIWLKILKKKEDDVAIKRLRTRISKWFLARYDFADAWRLHLNKYSANIDFAILFFLITAFIACPCLVTQSFWEEYIGKYIILAFGIVLCVFTILSAVLAFSNRFLQKNYDNILRADRRQIIWERYFWTLYSIIVIGIMILLLASPLCWIIKVIGLLCGIIVLVPYNIAMDAISNIHILYPRLFASITAAWLSLAIGNELFTAFFDASPSFTASFILGGIVFLFILYEVSRHYPLISTLKKIWRSTQMLVYSYAISLVIGLLLINFTGPEFLERSDYLPKYFEEYHAENVKSTEYCKISYHEDTCKITINKTEDSPTNLSYLKKLERTNVKHKKHPIASVWTINSTHHFFVLRDFLIQFAFLAMFIGVFIQMIFEEKSITDM